MHFFALFPPLLLAHYARAACPDYSTYSQDVHSPLSSGRYKLSYQRPTPSCRTYSLPEVENVISSMNKTIKDPDLFRLFQNAFPNTLDTAIKWKGTAANNSEEELTFIITGDINAMWLRDSANQLQSYLSLLKPSTSSDSLASLYRGVINLQSRYLLENSFCQSFQPPTEAHIAPSVNSAANNDQVTPPYSNLTVFECKYELDSLAAFLEVSKNYHTATNDLAFFGKYQWLDAVQTVMNTATSMMISTYASNGTVNSSPYTFQRTTSTSEDTLDNTGNGNPVQGGTGLIRSAFRPSDDATIYQLFIPANMMFASFLESTAPIVSALKTRPALAQQMESVAKCLRSAISQYGIVNDVGVGQIYAYEIDGYGSRNLMDDANIPSLLSAPLFDYLPVNDTVYQATRKNLLSTNNPYWNHGPVISSIGGPHDGPGHAWPMASIVRIMTSSDDDEIYDTLKQIVSSTDQLGLIHESINPFNATDYTRQWFSWANGLFGQMIIDLASRKPELLSRSYQ